MKKVVGVIIIFVLGLPLLSKACDTCNCGTDKRYISILPDFREHVFGLRYRYSSLHSYVNINGSATPALEKYNALELWGGWNITRKIRIMASVPYRFAALNSQAITTSKNGVGDISLVAYYNLLNSKHTIDSEKLLFQSLWFGVGIETPTGEYDSSEKSKLNEGGNLHQLGSRSTDVIFNVVYNMCLRNTELNLSSTYKINTVNKYGYEYGNYFNVNALAFYKFCLKHTIAIAPDIGAQFENFQHSVDDDNWDQTASGDLLMGTVGVETNFKRIAIGANFQTPLLQTLGKGMVESNNRFMAHIAFAL
jgi:hypothetical protein